MWVLTAPQVELLAIDAPLVVYDHDKDKKKGKNGKKEFKKANPLSVLKAQKKWEDAQKAQGDKPIVLNMSGFAPQSE